MVIDTSAILAIFWDEPNSNVYLKAIQESLGPKMSALTLYECCVVVFGDRRKSQDVSDLRLLVEKLGIEIIPFTSGDAFHAADAYQEYGKGLHPAGLNLGDCPAYALARSTDEPLLFAGQDFAKTDVLRAI